VFLDTNRGRPLYIIDGYNVIFNKKYRQHGDDVEKSRELLIRAVRAYAAEKKIEANIVWDGSGVLSGQRGDSLCVKNIYSKRGQSADEKIVRMVERMSNRKRVIVVSNDRRHISDVVNSLGARSMKVEDFLVLIRFNKKGIRDKLSPIFTGSQKEEDAIKEKEAAQDLSVEEWLRIFEKR